MKTTGFSLLLAALVAGDVSGVLEPSHRVPTSAASMGVRLFSDIARHENPAVVSIIVRSRRGSWQEDENGNFRFFQHVPNPRAPVRRTIASGFLISDTGEIVTNNHVVEAAERIEVSLFGNERQRYQAVVVGRDPRTDSALIRLQSPPGNLHPATLGDSSTLEPGDWVMAIGSPFGFGHSASVGIVSFPRRPVEVEAGRWQDLIQSDASINLGNSGGPLFNVRGEVVGINVAMIVADTDAGGTIGFAIPINTVKTWLPQMRTGKVVRGHLGVEFHRGPILEDEAIALRLPTAAGAIVMEVDTGSAAERGGLQPGDVIVAVDGTPVADARDLVERTAVMVPGTPVRVKTLRNGKVRTRMVIIEEQPDAAGEEPSPLPLDDDDGLTLGDQRPRTGARQSAASAVGGALVVKVAPDSPADDAELRAGDIVRAINGESVQTKADAHNELRRIRRGLPVFLLVSRHGTNLFLQMRTN